MDAFPPPTHLQDDPENTAKEGQWPREREKDNDPAESVDRISTHVIDRIERKS